MRRRRRALVALLVAALAATGVATVSTQAGAEEAGQGIDWKPCPDAEGVDCASIEVPLDWSRPHGDSIDIGLARRQATDPDARQGSILMDPGGPGGSGVQLVKDTAVFTDRVNERFDTIGFDPRGVNSSTPIECDAELVEQAVTKQFPETSEQFDETVALSAEVSDDCRDRTGPLYDNVDNTMVVRDMEAIRVALGEGDLNYVGYSYGTLMGQQYAEAFPGKIRAMVMDGNMDHSITSTWKHMSSQVKAAEQIFRAFARWCDGDTSCALNGEGTAKFYDELRARSQAGELTDPGSGEKIDFPTFSGLVPQHARASKWASLATTLKGLRDGEATAKSSAVEPATTNLPNQAMWCQDWNLPIDDYAQWRSLRDRLAKKYPHTQWTAALNNSLMCTGYTGKTTNPQAELDIDGAPPLVMLGNTHDPATVYSWTTAAAEQSGAALITYEGFGHTIYAYGRSSACVNDAVDAYLIDLKVPADGTRCPSVEEPGDGGSQQDPVADALGHRTG